MITTTLDPITLNDVTDIENAPYVIEGEGDGAIKIYFESVENKQACPGHTGPWFGRHERVKENLR